MRYVNYNVKCQNDDFSFKSSSQTVLTTNLSKAHVTRDSIGAATWVISVQRTINVI